MLQRTDLAEEFVARFAAVPMVAECVFLRPKYARGESEREVADLLIVHRKHAIVVSLKHQADPKARRAAKAQRWARSRAEKAADQLRGAIKTLRSRSFWCEHTRRGRVDFDVNALEPVEAVAAVEIDVGILSLPDEVPLIYQDVPFSYFSVNDLLNLICQLRTFPELQFYLRERAHLPDDTRRVLGGERLLYDQYLLNEGGFGGWRDFNDAIRTRPSRTSTLMRVASEKQRLDERAEFVEVVMDRLSERISKYDEGLAPAVAAQFDPSSRRKNYLLMQEELCDLTLFERRALGELRQDVVSRAEELGSPCAPIYRAYIDHSRDRVYIIAACRGYDRKNTIDAAQQILLGGLAFYQKKRGIVIVERLGENFELLLVDGFSQHDEFKVLGAELFARVAVSTFVGSLAAGPERVT